MSGYKQPNSTTKPANSAWNFVDTEVENSKRAAELDPWNTDSQAIEFAFIVQIGSQQPANRFDEIDSSVTAVDPWNPGMPTAIEYQQIHYLEPQWLPSFDNSLTRRPNLFLAIDGRRFDSIKTRIQWIMGAVGPTPRSAKNAIQDLLEELFEEDRGNEVRFRKLQELATSCDSYSEFISTLSLKLWWLRRPEFWKVRGTGGWNFRFEETAKGSMTFPMCQEMAISAGLPSTWDHLPIDDWLTKWQSLKNAHLGSWTFADWVYRNTTQPNLWEDSMFVWNTDEIELDRMSIEHVLSGSQRKGSNTGSGTMAQPNGIAPLLQKRLIVWNEKQDKKEKHAKRRVTSSHQHMGESGEQTQKDRQDTEQD